VLAADLERLLGLLEEWCVSLEGPNPLGGPVQSAYQTCVGDVATRRAALTLRREAIATRLESLDAESARLRLGVHTPPAPPPTRTAHLRDGRPGATLWASCDFVPGLAPEARAGLEAALEAAGLLDAWISPDGALVDAVTGDAFLVAGRSAPARRGLGAWLEPVPGGAIPEAVIRGVLAHLGAGPDDGETWVDLSGRWQLGPLAGRHAKPAAEHVGQSARERARRERLAQLDAERAGLTEDASRLEAELALVAATLSRAGLELAGLPGEQALRDAHARLAAARAEAARLLERLEETVGTLPALERALGQATEALQGRARDLGLADLVSDLAALEREVSRWKSALVALWPTLRSARRVRLAAAAAAAERKRAADERDRRARAAETTAREAAAAEAEFQVLASSVGASVRDVQARLAEARRALADVQRAAAQTAKGQAEAGIAHAVASTDVTNRTLALDERRAQRDVAVGGLRALVDAGLLAVADPDGGLVVPASWSASGAVELARRIEVALARTPHDEAAWARVQREIHGHFQSLTDELLRHTYSPTAAFENDTFVVTVLFHGRPCSIPQLAAAIREELDSRQAVLDAREREILENHLIGEISVQLHELLRSAERWVGDMNAELHARPTSTGMTLRFDWQPSEAAPAGFAEARKRLLRAGATWSPEERQALGAFLQQQIAGARAANVGGSWNDHLSVGLDYRAWHQFVVERQQEGVWKRLTRKTHGTGSSGEKAVALTIPQFAAAAAHYRWASPLAPRLILLDEAFVGIDNDMRGKCLGLMNAFDLDFVMTSEREWACYPTLPGVAIYQLATKPGLDAVHVTRWVWNGRQRVQDEPTLPPAAPPEVELS
jgi:uncharacterized protein (TIGR02680 family)